jgi:hypothetical protein
LYRKSETARAKARGRVEGGNVMKRSLVCVLSILALASTAPLMAQSEQSASGTVVSSSSNQLVIRTSEGRQMTFMVDNNTNRPSSLAQGSSVTVRYHDMNGTFHAANVAASGSSNSNLNTSAGNTNTTTATTGTASPTGTTGVTGSTAGATGTMATTGRTGTTGTTGSTATGTSATGANAQDRGTTADPTGNDARNTRTPAEDATGTTGTRDTGTATGTTRSTTATQRNMDAQQDPATTGTTGTTGTVADQDTGTTRLPATASPLPLMGLSGLLALGGGLGVRIIRRRK